MDTQEQINPLIAGQARIEQKVDNYASSLKDYVLDNNRKFEFFYKEIAGIKDVQVQQDKDISFVKRIAISASAIVSFVGGLFGIVKYAPKIGHG